MAFDVYLLDTSVFLHKVEGWFSRLDVKISDEQLYNILEAQFLWMHNLGFLPPDLRSQRTRIVYAMDRKKELLSGQEGYWRHEELGKLMGKRRKRNKETGQMESQPILYKGNRGLNHEHKNSPDRTLQKAYWVKRKSMDAFNRIKSMWYTFSKLEGLEVYEYPGYEADDCAATFVQLNPDKKILLCTVDQDWVGLVSGNVSWYDVGGYQRPHLLNLDTIYDWASTKGHPLGEPSDIWLHKVRTGDKSDNLPAGVPLEFYSLLEPPDEHRLWIDNRLQVTDRQPERLDNPEHYRKHLENSYVEDDLGQKLRLNTFCK